MPIVSVNPEADPPQPRAPVRPNRAEQDGETTEEKSQEHKHKKEKETEIGYKKHVEKQSRKRTRDESRQAHEPRKQNVRRSLITRTPVSGARDTHGVIFVIASSELTGEPLTRTPVVYSRGKEREYSSLNDHLQEDSPKTDIFTQESAKS